MLWASSYLALGRGVGTEAAAGYASLFFIGITVGRALSGFLTMRFADAQMIRMGQALVALGAVMLLLPLGTGAALAGLVVIGLGCAPIYPCIIHSTPEHFGAENSQALIGVQMASAYVGTLAMPPLFGLIANHISIGLFPIFLLVVLAAMGADARTAGAQNADEGVKREPPPGWGRPFRASTSVGVGGGRFCKTSSEGSSNTASACSSERMAVWTSSSPSARVPTLTRRAPPKSGEMVTFAGGARFEDDHAVRALGNGVEAVQGDVGVGIHALDGPGQFHGGVLRPVVGFQHVAGGEADAVAPRHRRRS